MFDFHFLFGHRKMKKENLSHFIFFRKMKNEKKNLWSIFISFWTQNGMKRN